MALNLARLMQIHSPIQTESPVKNSARLTNFKQKGQCEIMILKGVFPNVDMDVQHYYTFRSLGWPTIVKL